MNNDYVSLVLNDLLSRTRYSKLKLNTYHLNEIKKKLDGKTITFKVKTGETDKVFGTISNKQISEKLKDMGYKIDKKCIKSDIAISSLGVTKVVIELH